MATTRPVRVLETSSVSYDFLEIQILEESYNHGLKGMVSSIGSITFQKNKNETDWYGMRFLFNTSRVSEIALFYKIIKIIDKKSSWNSQPQEIIDIINGRRYFIQNQEFFKESDKGKLCYMVMQNNENYARLVAKDLSEANTKLNKYLNSISSRIHNYTYSIGDSFLIE